MPQSPMVSLAPRVQLSVGRDGCTVPTAAGDVSDMLSLQAFHHLGTVVGSTGAEEKNDDLINSSS